MTSRNSAGSCSKDCLSISLSPLFRATVEATEEAVVNALLAARTMTGRDGHTLHALPVDRTLELVDAAGRLAR